MKTKDKFEAGISLTEVLATLVILSVVMAGVIGFFLAYKRLGIQQDIAAGLGANLRSGMRQLSNSIRGAGYGVPKTNLSAWVPNTWVAGFTANPNIVAGATATLPDTVSVATCTIQPVATLTANATLGATALTVSSTSLLNTTNRSLISIDLADNALVTSVTSSTAMTIDTDPVTTGLQGLQKAYPIGTPICRVGIDTYSVNTGNYRLLLDHNDGGGAQPLLDGIQNLKVSGANQHYQITLTARSERPDPETNSFVTRRMSSAITQIN